MSKPFVVGKGNLAKITFGKTDKTSGAQLKKDGTLAEDLRSRLITLSQFIPNALAEDLNQKVLSDLGEKIAKAEPGSRIPISRDNLFTAKGQRLVNSSMKSSIRETAVAYMAFYIATIKAIDRVLQNPKIPPTMSDKQVNTTIALEIGRELAELGETGVSGLTRRVSVKENWSGLAQITVEQKKSQKYANTFWKHTGQASRAFHASAVTKLSRLKLRDFHTSVEKKVTVVPSSNIIKSSPGKFISQVRFSIKLGVPKWSPKLDVLFTFPFATGSKLSPTTSTGLDLKLYEKHFADVGPGVTTYTNKRLEGLDRILAAESRRPWIRDIAALSGAELQNYLTGNAVKVPTKSALAQQVRAAQERARDLRKSEREDLLKKRAEEKTKKLEQEANRKAARAREMAFEKMLRQTESRFKRSDNLEVRLAARFAKANGRPSIELGPGGRRMTERDRDIKANRDALRAKSEQTKGRTPIISAAQRKAREKAQQKEAAMASKRAARSGGKTKARAGKSATLAVKPVDLRAMSRANPNDFYLRMASIKRTSKGD